MTLQPISKVSKAYGVSTRTLRYYEQLGLLQSSKLPGYAYRAYDEEALSRLRQILVLRKLRIPLKQIGVILETRDARLAIEVFEQSITGLQSEKQALETIEGILRSFVRELEKLLPEPLSPHVFEQEHVMELVQALSVKTLSQKEETSMEELNRASELLEHLKDIRILYLPPMTVASCQSTGDNQEEVVGAAISTFIKESGLGESKPDFRRIGFNNPASEQSGGSLGYEAWVSIPGDMEVPAPLVKKQFLGGLYAAHMIAFGEFQEWGRLWQWVMDNGEYDVDFSPRTDPADPRADPSLEEQLNAIHHLEDASPFGTQLDLLVPIKPKQG
ncbi:transcriptional regulator, MerR family [Desulfitobacterium hafniense DCB-2]|uniref:Transcriptional regulator, MerR family n=1 Tax=Desulfitobacterium hafniense (strain DSM 10664 / DCB-2) TaxID=272564 RepID=B8FZA0_DESHD|nr:effector binding domain-containing protein [Desulfitobacterium hafniense]ACL18183.1 transcriptional regulator, MerR family [Desulfitobacterium hafniense DCB-2]